jgi:parallel beta-helix repeat protein
MKGALAMKKFFTLLAILSLVACSGKKTEGDGTIDGPDVIEGDGADVETEGDTSDTIDGDDPGEDPDEDEDAPGPCIDPHAGMIILEDTLLCAGTFAIEVGHGVAAVTIEGSDLALTCDGTMLEGTGGFGTTEEPTVGIRIDGGANVTVRGCGARGFRYGLVANDATAVRIENANLDDNFTDPSADWVQDTVQGGGLRLEGVTGGSVMSSTFARNWNGIELRGTREVTVGGNVADHCSNTGATLADAHDNELSDNDFSWGIRGAGLSYPDAWYGIDTKDSAGLIVDAGSSGNRLLRNDCTYGGDGIFIRAVIGACATGNRLEGNDTSFSPHNAIECWCDDNVFIGNTASDSHYGLWLGGSDRAIVTDNRVERNVVDGMSIQIGEDRHTLIENNIVTGSGRVGILLTGRQIQAWQDLDYWDPNLANSSHLVVQRNTFGGNTRYDLFVTSTRSIVLASNCTETGGEPSVHVGPETEVYKTASSCGAGDGRLSPTASLSAPASAGLGADVSLDASGSLPAETGDPLAFTWLVQPHGARFVSGALPSMVLGGDGPAVPTTSFTSPGIYDVDVTVDDGRLAAMAWSQVAVVPGGVRVGEEAAGWDYACESASTCVTTVTDDPGGIEGSMVHITTDAPYDFSAVYPSTRDLGLDLAAYTTLGFFVQARNDNEYGWQGSYPVIVLAGSWGTIRLEPSSNLLPTQPGEWTYMEIPLDGGSGWTLTVTGTPGPVDWLEIHTDTWGWIAVDLWLDAISFY